MQKIVARNDHFDVVTCRDGEEAIRALAARQFDVVLLDLVMPGRNGFDVVAFLQQHRPVQLGVVLVLTGDPDEFRARLDPSIVHALVEKPFDCNALVTLIRNIINGSSEED
jgi:DNA-binding response OmpR family regulator